MGIGCLRCQLWECYGDAAGFMGTGAALIRRSDQGLEGLILEKVNGMPLEKRYISMRSTHFCVMLGYYASKQSERNTFVVSNRLLKDETFADADYTLEMMYQAC